MGGMFVIPELGKWRQEGQEGFKASPYYKSKFERLLGYNDTLTPKEKQKNLPTCQGNSRLPLGGVGGQLELRKSSSVQQGALQLPSN